MKTSLISVFAFIVVAFIIPGKANAQQLIGAWPKYNSSTAVNPANATAKHALITTPTLDWKTQLFVYNDNEWFYVSGKDAYPTPVSQRYIYPRILPNGVVPPDSADDYMTFTFNVPTGYELILSKFIIRTLMDERNLRLHLRSNTNDYRYDLITSYYDQRKETQINNTSIRLDSLTGKQFGVYTADINVKSAGYSTVKLRLYLAEGRSIYVYFYGVDMKYSGTSGGGNTYPNPYPAYADYMIIFEGSLNSIYYADGSGDGTSEEQAFLIQTKEHLNNVRYSPGSYFRQIADISFSESDFQSGGAYYNSGTCWQPIGNSTTNFTGSYNGQGHTISGLKINDPTGSNIGLFGYISGSATIKNLGLEDVNISGKDSVGGLVGYYNGSGIVSQCFVKGTISGNLSTGGLIGFNNTTINNCYSICDVTSSGSNIGGFVGYNNSGTISLSYSASTVTTGGGFAGTTNSSVENNCFWNTELTALGVITNTAGFNGLGKNTTEMKSASTYAEWSGDIWRIDNTQTINNGYPFLAWQGSSGLPLPVELSSFTAVISGGNVILNWQTETESNNSGFEIERAIVNNKPVVDNWKSIGFVKGAGNSNSPKEYSFSDPLILNPNLQYRLKQINNDGTYSYSPEVEVLNSQPTAPNLFQNYPNPFNPSTVISYQISADSKVSLRLFDILGNEVAVLIDKEQTAGSYNYQFSTVDYQIPSGVYVYTITAGEYRAVRKMVLMK